MPRPANIKERTLHLSVLLTFIAGFCDAATFMAADRLFSAHVLGNLLIVAYDTGRQVDWQAWIKLASLPVFMASIITGWWISSYSANRYALLLAEGALLVGANLLGIMLTWLHVPTPGLTSLIALAIVFAMGLQSTFTQLYTEETDGLTTVLTGRVVQAILLLLRRWSVTRTKSKKNTSFKRQTLFIASFVAGCLLGAIGAKKVGLSIVIAPGILLLFFASSWQIPASGKE